MKAIQTGDTILFQGDSITDCGRRDPAGDGLGNGYVAMVSAFLQLHHPGLKLRIINRGISGDRTPELLARWQGDMADLRPQVLSIKVGVNDVWRLRGEWAGQKYVPLPEYEQNYRKLLEQAKASGVRQLVLMSPTTIEGEKDAELSRLLDERMECVKRLAKEFGAIYVPTRETQKEVLRTRPDVRWTSDGCHPTTAGHALLAATWLKAIADC
jgi:lysophospholipase L1-like esterase